MWTHLEYFYIGSWFSPEIKGCRPPPCADFTLTSIDIHRAVLYGGCRPPEGKRLDKDLYIINFTTMVAKINSIMMVVNVQVIITLKFSKGDDQDRVETRRVVASSHSGSSCCLLSGLQYRTPSAAGVWGTYKP